MNEAYLKYSKVESQINIDNAYKKITLSLDKVAIREDDFSDFYSTEKIETDKKTVFEYESLFKEHTTEDSINQVKRASVLEYLVYEQGELAEWLGKNIITVKTSRFDDIKNGVDVVIEFETEKDQYLGLGIDVSFSSSNLEKKLGRIKSEINEGHLAQVEYYKSTKSTPRKLTDIPRIVIACDAHTVDELNELWLEKDKEKLANHPIQLQIASQIYSQLNLYEQYARYVAKNETIADIYKETLILFRPILAEKNQQFMGHQGKYFDKAYDRLSGLLSSFEMPLLKAKPQEEMSERLKLALERKRQKQNK